MVRLGRALRAGGLLLLFLPGTLPYFPLFPHLSLFSPRPPLLLPLVFPWALQAGGSFLRQVAVFPPFQKAFYQPCSTQWTLSQNTKHACRQNLSSGNPLKNSRVLGTSNSESPEGITTLECLFPRVMSRFLNKSQLYCDSFHLT